MTNIHAAAAVPEGAVEIVGVVDGQPLESVPMGADLAGFEGERGSTRLVVADGRLYLLVGLGDEVDVDGLRLAAGAAARAVPAGRPAATSLHRLDIEGALEATVGGYLAAAYRFDAYRSEDKPPAGDLHLVGEADPDDLARASDVAAAVARARDWSNRPSADKEPVTLAEEMGARLEDAGMTVEIWDEDRIEEERLGGLVAVAAGSVRPPRMLVAHTSSQAGSPRLALVGKGIVFDSGGLSLKPADMMETMKRDMAGAAAVVAAAEVIARRTDGLSLDVYVPLTDNMPGGRAMKPGDVVRARNGKTIEVLNTDAEGRLVLADALCLAVEAGPDLVVDVATLTGAARVALGDHLAALFSSTDEAKERLMEAGAEAGERIWPMPLPADYRKLIDSSVADMKNTGGRYGGAIAAALLLAEFTGDVPWAHLDIAGPSWFSDGGPRGPKGASGFGVGTLIALAEGLLRS